ERDREVVLLRNVGGALDPELLDDVAANVEADDVPGLLLGVGRVVGELHAARLPAATRQNLRLDDDLAAELLGRRARLVRRRCESPVGHGDPELPEQLLALVLVEVHRPRRTIAACIAPMSRERVASLCSRWMRSSSTTFASA